MKKTKEQTNEKGRKVPSKKKSETSEVKVRMIALVCFLYMEV